jgi:hypothetical protein
MLNAEEMLKVNQNVYVKEVFQAMATIVNQTDQKQHQRHQIHVIDQVFVVVVLFVEM